MSVPARLPEGRAAAGSGYGTEGREEAGFQMKVRYRFAVGVVAALMSAGSYATSAHASTMSKGGGNKGGNSQHQSSTWKGDSRNDRRNDFRRDRFRDHDRFNHCCDNNNHDNGGEDCDWLRDHDHDAWVRDCE